MPSHQELPPSPGHRSWQRPALLALGVLVVGALVLALGSARFGHRPSPSAAAPATPAMPTAGPAFPTPPSTSSLPSASPSSTSRSTVDAATDTAPAAVVARRIEDLLQFSSNSRGAVVAAVNRVSACTEAYDDPDTLRSAAEQRLTLVDRAVDLSVTGLPHGEAMKRELLAAWRASAQADSHYADWAESQMGCYPKAYSTADSRAAAASTATARKHQKAFLAMWKPVATRYGLAARTLLTT